MMVLTEGRCRLRRERRVDHEIAKRNDHDAVMKL